MVGVPKENRPQCQLVGTDGNAFALIGKVSKVLNRKGLSDKAKEFEQRVQTEADSYDALLMMIQEYVEVI